MPDEPLFAFILMADPQLGMYANVHRRGWAATERFFIASGLQLPSFAPTEGFAREIEAFDELIDHANATRPAFVVSCGDMVEFWDNDEQLTAVRGAAARLDASIPMHWVPGNHDVAENQSVPTHRALERYRANFGADYYTFDQDDSRFIVMNSSIFQQPEQVADELKAQLAFLEQELRASTGARHTVVFSHHPWFLEDPGEDVPAQRWMVLPPKMRSHLLGLAARSRVAKVFAGHTHRNQQARFGEIEIVQTTAVGVPLGPDPSGFRTVRVYPDRIEHEWQPLKAGLRFAAESEALRRARG